MKKFSLTLMFYCLLGLLFYSCCIGEYRILGSSELVVSGSTADDPNSLNTMVTGRFALEDVHNIELASNLKASFGTTAAYATTCDYSIGNPILIDQMELYFDQPLELENVQLPASFNILSDPTFRNHITINHEAFDGFSSVFIELGGAFFNPPIFTDGPMNIRLVTRTEDRFTFENEVDVVVDMQ